MSSALILQDLLNIAGVRAACYFGNDDTVRESVGEDPGTLDAVVVLVPYLGAVFRAYAEQKTPVEEMAFQFESQSLAVVRYENAYLAAALGPEGDISMTMTAMRVLIRQLTPGANAMVLPLFKKIGKPGPAPAKEEWIASQAESNKPLLTDEPAGETPVSGAMRPQEEIEATMVLLPIRGAGRPSTGPEPVDGTLWSELETFLRRHFAESVVQELIADSLREVGSTRETLSRQETPRLIAVLQQRVHDTLMASFSRACEELGQKWSGLAE
jgi:hypothetical protein